MTKAGWIIMISSLVVVWVVMIFCYVKLLSTPPDRGD